MRGDELGELAAQALARRLHHVALGAAAVGHHAIRFEMRFDLREQRTGLLDRYRQQDEVGFVRRRAWVVGDLVDHAQLERTLEIGAAASDAGHAWSRRRLP